MEQQIDSFALIKDYDVKIATAWKIISYVRKNPSWHLSLDKRRKEIVRGAKRFWDRASASV